MKKIIIEIILFILLFIALALINLFYFPLSYEKLNIGQRCALRRINKELESCISALPKEEQKIISYEAAMDCLNPVTKKFAKRILAINPADLGFKGPIFSLAPASDLVKIEAKEFEREGNKINTGINFLPRLVFEDYERMNKAMQEELGRELYVNSGYRSPGYQANLFLFYLGDENQYSLYENAKWIALPGYSEHNSKNTAIDFINEAGINGQSKGQTAEDFEKLTEYSWLTANASKYNFYLTYPRDNAYGVNFEPWHWHWGK